MCPQRKIVHSVPDNFSTLSTNPSFSCLVDLASLLFSATLNFTNLRINLTGNGLSIGKFRELFALLYWDISFSNLYPRQGSG